MSKPTPGPWTRGWGNFVYQGEGFNARNTGRHIATCEPSSRTQKDWDQVFANARLIAAAPDLLEALQTLTSMAESFAGELHAKHPDVVTARAAIAKATEGP